MLKIVRALAVDNPWVLKIIMGVIALTFVITMGWWGIKAPGENIVMSVNGHDVNVQEYRKAYNRAIEFYRNTYKDKFDAEMLEKMKVKDKVLEDLAGRELWLEEAAGLGLRVSDEELRDSIIKMNVFHKDGKFDRTLYDRVLAANRMNVNDFENVQRTELLIDKVKMIIKDSVSVTEEEINETFPVSLPGSPQMVAAERPLEEMQRLKKFIQFQKAEKAIMAYAEAMRAKAKINVNKDLL